MDDLISKSALIDALKVHFDSCFREDGELLYSDHICTSDDVVDLINLVENQHSYIDDEVSDVCEWKKFNDSNCLFETSCGNISGMYRGFNFCPYCGKKIKVVGD